MSTVCVARLKKEHAKLKADPSSYFDTVPLPNDIRTWHYVLKGPTDTPFYGGYYHGVIKFPSDYPYKPPSIIIFTPNGRFKTNTRICLSNSDFHPESWSPFWSLSNILTGFLSYMCEDNGNIGGIGSLQTTKQYKIECAMKSMTFNNKNELFRKLFPKYHTLYITNKEKFDNAHIHSSFFANMATNNKLINKKSASTGQLKNRNKNANENDNNNGNGNGNNSDSNIKTSTKKQLTYMEKLYQNHEKYKQSNGNERNENIRCMFFLFGVICARIKQCILYVVICYVYCSDDYGYCGNIYAGWSCMGSFNLISYNIVQNR